MSLKDQLLKAGLIDQSKAQKAEQDQRKQAHQKTAKAQKQAKKSGEVVVDEAKLLAEKVLQEKAERSKELNRQQREQAEKKAIQAQIKQLITLNSIDRKRGDLAYQFADGNKIKKLYLTHALQDQLAYGIIVLVKFGDGYELVPRQIAEKIAQRDATCILVQNASSLEQQAAMEDDPYADFKIPDDLMW
ncbi:MAG: nucleoprotein/polynucleotide-associated enzyme [Thiothrix lacustris]|uniref:Nucleoprotein/polynucleotide-associated enzyme n=1 Tax=Thiothrix lacustris TaxID=525917 RepID=A0A1Y1QLJ1_9GAMM|nr:MAG: nucleoprotein/polynucleotide-associated enzyme [Thiothrix lacustris]